jgi:hypothetical protein
MLEPKTHFGQVPLEIVREIVRGQIRRETLEQDQGIRNRTLEDLFGAQEQSTPRGKFMIAPFDIFLTEAGGSLRWLEAAETLEAAKARVQELALCSPGEYVLLDQRTGNKIVIKSDAVGGAPGANRLRFPVWEQPYQEARKEPNPEKLSERVTAAETAIYRRLQELGNLSEENSETIAIQDALNVLFTMKNEELNWERLFQEVLLEHRPKDRHAKIQAAEAAIYRRLQALQHNSNDQAERQVIADAVSVLRTLQEQK